MWSVSTYSEWLAAVYPHVIRKLHPVAIFFSVKHICVCSFEENWLLQTLNHFTSFLVVGALILVLCLMANCRNICTSPTERISSFSSWKWKVNFRVWSSENKGNDFFSANNYSSLSCFFLSVYKSTKVLCNCNVITAAELWDISNTRWLIRLLGR